MPTTTNAIRADGLRFDRGCMAVPAETASTVTFANDDVGETHNVAIYPEDSCIAKAGKAGVQPQCGRHLFDPALSRGRIVLGPTDVTYHLPALPAGRYIFLCDVHPPMHGTFRVV